MREGVGRGRQKKEAKKKIRGEDRGGGGLNTVSLLCSSLRVVCRNLLRFFLSHTLTSRIGVGAGRPSGIELAPGEVM